MSGKSEECARWFSFPSKRRLAVVGSKPSSWFYKAVRDQRILSLVVAIFCAALIASLPGRLIHVDEGWLGEFSYWFARVGHAKSEMFRGLLHYEHKMLVYHKLFIVQGGLFIKAFGLNAYVLKSINVIYLIIAMPIALRVMCFDVAPEERKRALLLFATLLLANPMIFSHSFNFRPELMIMVFGLCSYYFLRRAVESEVNRLHFSLAGGLFAGLCLLSHLNGATFVLAGLGFLLVEKRWSALFVFGVGAGVASLLWFFDVRSVDDFHLLLTQFRNDPGLKESNFNLLGQLLNTFAEHKRFFHGPKQIWFSVLAGFAGLSFFGFLRREHRRLLTYAGLLILALAVLCRSKEVKYMIPYLPYLCILLVVCLQRVARDPVAGGKWRGEALALLSLAYLVSSLVLNWPLIREKETMVEEHRRLAAYLVPKSTVAVPSEFIFSEMENFDLRALKYFDLLEERVYKDGFDLFSVAEKESVDAIVADKRYMKTWHLDRGPGRRGNYERILLEKDACIFRRVVENAAQ